MNGRRVAGAIVGGIAAGAGITALMLAQEKRTGTPSELARLERSGRARLGGATPPGDAVPAPREQAAVQGGHLALSAAAGAIYGLATDEDTDVVASGVAFGLFFYLSMHWVLGPLLRIKEPEWRADKGTIGMHAANHVLFGLLTAASAKAAQHA